MIARDRPIVIIILEKFSYKFLKIDSLIIKTWISVMSDYLLLIMFMTCAGLKWGI